MYYNNPNPRSFAELTALLDERNRKHGIKPHEEKEFNRLAVVAKTYEKLAGEY